MSTETQHENFYDMARDIIDFIKNNATLINLSPKQVISMLNDDTSYVKTLQDQITKKYPLRARYIVVCDDDDSNGKAIIDVDNNRYTYTTDNAIQSKGGFICNNHVAAILTVEYNLEKGAKITNIQTPKLPIKLEQFKRTRCDNGNTIVELESLELTEEQKKAMVKPR